MRNLKAICEWKHTKKRALERLGLSWNCIDRLKIHQKIREGDGVFLGKETNRVSVWKLNYQEKDFVALYDLNRSQIITVFTLDMWPRK